MFDLSVRWGMWDFKNWEGDPGNGGMILKWGVETSLRTMLQINSKVLYKLIVSLLLCVASHAQSTQNNKFTISLQYLKK